MKFTMNTLSVSALLLFGGSHAVLAQACTEGPTYTYNCSSSGLGFTDTADGLTVNINRGADFTSGIRFDDDSTITNNGTIDVTGEALRMDEGNTVVNNGTIRSGTEEAISDDLAAPLNGDDNIITNNGTIETTGADKNAIELDDDNTITNNASGTIKAINGDAVKLDDDNTVTNNGTITSISDDGTTGADGIEADHNNKITNNGTITALSEGIEVEGQNSLADGNTVTNSATGVITAGGKGILAKDYNIITNDGLIVSQDDGIEVDDNNTVVNNGTIVTDDSDGHGIVVSEDNTVTNNGTINSKKGEGVRVDNDGNTITNNGLITTLESQGENGIYVRKDDNTIINNGTILAYENGIKADGDDDDDVTITNNGLISSQDREAIDLSDNNDGDDMLTNNGALIGKGSTIVNLGGGNDTFTWQANSSVVSSDGTMPPVVDMGDENNGNDHLLVDAADVIGTTRFNDLETYNIVAGSAAILEDLKDENFLLHTGSPTLLASTGEMVGSLTHDLTRRLLSSESGVTQGIQTTQGGLGSGKWWVFGNASFQTDNGQGFSQESQNITLGKNIGGFNVFFGLENAQADLSDNTQSVEQQMVYVGATESFQASANMDIIGLALLGATSSDYTTPGGSMDGNGVFGAVSGRVNYPVSDYVFGTYVGYAIHNTDPVATTTISFSSQSSDVFFGGLDFRAPTSELKNGMSLGAVFGVGFQNGSADAVTMSAGGGTTTISGTDSNQQFGSAGLDLTKGAATSSLRLRMAPGESFTVDLGFRISF